MIVLFLELRLKSRSLIDLWMLREGIFGIYTDRVVNKNRWQNSLSLAFNELIESTFLPTLQFRFHFH